MGVYVELVILDNLIITYFLASGARSLLKKKTPKLRTALGAAVGMAVSLFYPFVESEVWLILIKILLYALLCIIFFAGESGFFALSLAFLTLTAIFGGVIFAVAFTVKGSVEKALTESFVSFPFSVIIIGVFCAVKLTKLFIKSFIKRSRAHQFIYRFSVKLYGKSARFYGLIDTGNELYDSESGLPVVVVPFKTLAFLPNEKFAAILTGREGREEVISTAAGKEKIILIKPDEFILYSDEQANKIVEVMLGVSPASMSYDALLHSSMIR